MGDGLPPGPNQDFYTGLKLSMDWYNGNIEFLLDAYREYGPAFTTRIMGLKIVWLIGAEANQHMYVDNWRDYFWWGESIQGQLAGLIGNGLLASVDETHDKARRLLDPVFSNDNLEKYVDEMTKVTESEVEKFQEDERFDFYEWVYDLALKNASHCFMGMDVNGKEIQTLHENFDTCVEYYQKPIHFQTFRGPGTPHWYFKNARDKVDEILHDEIINRRKNGTKESDNILDRLLQAQEDGESFTNDEILDQIKTLYWAGHDTTISAISWLVMLLGKYPDVYDKVITEIDERVGDKPIESDEVIDGLPYLEMVMDEALRLYPPAWVAFRKTRTDISMYGYDIPEGTEVAFSSFATHRLPHLFDNPMAFRPRRMEPENQRDFPPGAYIPFARGPRTCIGMNFAKYEIKLIMATILRNFDYSLIPGQKFRAYPVATLTPDAVKIRVNKRINGSKSNGNSEPVESNFSHDEPSEDSGNGGCPVH